MGITTNQSICVQQILTIYQNNSKYQIVSRAKIEFDEVSQLCPKVKVLQLAPRVRFDSLGPLPTATRHAIAPRCFDTTAGMINKNPHLAGSGQSIGCPNKIWWVVFSHPSEKYESQLG